MNKNNKGFMLVETIVTSTIVLTGMIILYTSFNKIYNNYKVKSNYNNIDAIYATKKTINNFLATNSLNKLINNELSSSSYTFLIKETYCTNDELNSSCQNIQSLYKVNNMIVLKYSFNDIEKFKTNESKLNQTFYDYIDYLVTYYDIKNTEKDYSYIIFTEIESNDNYYYANLRMR